MNYFIKFSLLFICIVLTIHTNAQTKRVELPSDDDTTASESACPPVYQNSLAHYYVEFFLTLPERENDRVEAGATDETVEQIRPISDEAICSRLNAIVEGNSNFRRIDDTLPSTKTKYYYRTNNLYYIFWKWKPEHQVASGPKTLFIVVSKDFSNIWQFYY